jgi:hypothetical protein
LGSIIVPAFVQNNNVLEIHGLYAEQEGAYVNDASCSATINDASGTVVAGPLPMTHVPGSDGVYRAYVSEVVAFVPKASYVAVIEADGGALRYGHFEFHFKPLSRIVDEAV